MKNLLSILLVVILFLPNTYGQSLAFEPQRANTEFTSYSPANFINYHYHRPHSRNYYVGGIIGLSGCVVIWPGLVLYAFGSIQDYEAPHPNYGMQYAGIALMGAGAAMGIVGAVIGIKAKKEDKKRYGFRLITPGINQLGIAYNF